MFKFNPLKQYAIDEVKQFVDNTNEKVLAYVNDKYKAKLNPSFTFSFDPSESEASYCRTVGGKSSIYLSLTEYAWKHQNKKPISFNEYNEFRNYPFIGSLIDVSWQQAVTALIVHEIAHSVQNDNATKENAIEINGFSYANRKSKVLKSHGSFWKSIYKDLREQFVNHWNDIPLKKENEPLKMVEDKPKKLNTRYEYRGNITFILWFVYEELKLIIAKDKNNLFLSNNDFKLLNKLPFSSVTEARRSLLGF